jgi:hypothetical protein
MMARVFFYLVAAWAIGADSSKLSEDLTGAKNRPVTKVITLLKDMLKQLEKEASEDEEI